MTDNHSHLPPNLRNASEFKLRAKLRELLKDGNILHATLNQRFRVCGKRTANALPANATKLSTWSPGKAASFVNSLFIPISTKTFASG
ncbi:MAG: hypothetical protein IPM93_12070 [Candidatus Obscuribacter sp.]|nr:hypothetical protein [Candidatus Obscuribacter sp.]